MDDRDNKLNRREFAGALVRWTGLGLLGTAGVLLAKDTAADRMVWQLDPHKCIQCGRCATHCVMDPSAVRCFHSFPICGYCELCFGFFEPRSELNAGAENQACPTGAINRRFLEDPYYEYTIDREKCIGCAICVKGCTAFGNGSLQLQADHDRCKNCNQCTIAAACPAQAWRRVPASSPYLLKHEVPADE